MQNRATRAPRNPPVLSVHYLAILCAPVPPWLIEGLMEERFAQADHEPTPHLRPNSGWIEVIAGSMFSGKSEELIRRLRRARIARQKVQVFKPDIDSRFSDNHIVSHSEMKHESTNVQTAK